MSETIPRGLGYIEAKQSDDDNKSDLELVCTRCRGYLCDIENGTTLNVLVSMAIEHQGECTAKGGST